jgi:hypothetical protein
LIQDNTNFAYSGTLLYLKMQNPGDSGNMLYSSNAGSGNHITCVNGSTTTVFSVSHT